jgi:hypothetical protein
MIERGGALPAPLDELGCAPANFAQSHNVRRGWHR